MTYLKISLHIPILKIIVCKCKLNNNMYDIAFICGGKSTELIYSEWEEWEDLNSQKAGKETNGTKRKYLSDSESDDSKLKKKQDAADKQKGFARGLDAE